MKKSKGSTKEQMNKCMNEWMNEWTKKWLWEKVGFRDKVWREYRMSTENYWAKWCVSFFHQTDGTISVPTWMMGLWFSQHPTYSGFPSQLWLLESMFGHNQHPTIKYVQPKLLAPARPSADCAVAQWFLRCCGERSVLDLVSFLFFSFYKSQWGESLQAATLFNIKRIDSTIWRPPEFVSARC